jgi:hypothetical protein
MSLAPAFSALDDCDATIEELARLCCVPGRGKSLESLGRRLQRLRAALADVGDDPAAADTVLDRLEDIGADIGRLQIGCCAENRMPLYSDLLQGLTAVQLTMNESVGRGH